MSIYPNPGTEELNISLQDITDAEVRITDLTGRIIFASPMEQNTLRVEVKTLPAAMYLVQVKGQHISMVQLWLKVTK